MIWRSSTLGYIPRSLLDLEWKSWHQHNLNVTTSSYHPSVAYPRTARIVATPVGLLELRRIGLSGVRVTQTHNTSSLTAPSGIAYPVLSRQLRENVLSKWKSTELLLTYRISCAVACWALQIICNAVIVSIQHGNLDSNFPERHPELVALSLRAPSAFGQAHKDFLGKALDPNTYKDYTLFPIWFHRHMGSLQAFLTQHPYGLLAYVSVARSQIWLGISHCLLFWYSPSILYSFFLRLVVCVITKQYTWIFHYAIVRDARNTSPLAARLERSQIPWIIPRRTYLSVWPSG